MNNGNQPEKTTHRILPIVCATVLVVAFTFTVAWSQPTHANVTPPPVPDEIKVEAGNTAFLVGHAVGTQNYICLPCPNPTTPAAMCPDTSGFAWLLFTPEATLFTDNEKQLTTHFFSPNPAENGTIRATWEHSRDSSIVWGGRAIASTDARFVAKDAVAWLLLPAAGAQEGPKGGDTLTETTFIHRLNTEGGVAPATGCTSLTDVGKKAFQPYTADYFFYRRSHGQPNDGE
jgi:hypothetical protein